MPNQDARPKGFIGKVKKFFSKKFPRIFGKNTPISIEREDVSGAGQSNSSTNSSASTPREERDAYGNRVFHNPLFQPEPEPDSENDIDEIILRDENEEFLDISPDASVSGRSSAGSANVVSSRNPALS